MEKIKKQFEKFEIDNSLNELNVFGYPAWEIVRFFVLQEIFIQKGKTKQAIYPRKNIFFYVLKNVFLIFSNILNLFLLCFKKEKYKVLFLGHPRRQKEEDGFYYDIYTDLIKKEFRKNNIKYISFEETYFNFYTPISKYSKQLYKLDLIYIIYLFLIRFKNLNKHENEKLLVIEKKLNKEFGVKINLVNKIKKDLYLFSLLVKFYSAILIKLKIESIVEVVGFSIWAKALNFSAKKLKISTYELQHGIVGDNLACGLQEEFEGKTIPDYFLTYGKFWNNIIDFPKKQKIIDVGFPYFEGLLNSSINNNKYKEDILIISQGNISDKLSFFTKKIALKYKEKQFYYKLHPGEFTNDEIIKKNLSNIKNVKLIYNEYSIYELFGKIGFSIGVSSTSLYESFLFGNKVFIVALDNNYTVYRDLINKNIFGLIDQKNITLDFKKYNFNIDEYFTKNGLKNILKIITK